MVYLLALCVGGVCAVIGWLATGMGGLALSGAAPASGDAPLPLAIIMLSMVGAAVGLMLGVMLTLWRYGGVRPFGDILRRSTIAVAILGVLAAGAVALHHTLLDHLGMSAKAPAVEFEIRMPHGLARHTSKSEVQVELRTDRNQTVARLRDQWGQLDDGRPVLRGEVPIAFKTTQRLVALNLPGQPTRLFKLRLAASPSHSDTFSPWIQVDAVDAEMPPGERMKMTDGFAIRYRVL